MTQTRTEILILMLMAIVLLLMVAIAGLFWRMTQLQREVLAALAYEETPRWSVGLELGTTVPDFELTDTEGQAVSLADLAGQKALLAFSSTQCPACNEMYPHLKAFSENRRDIQIIMVSYGTVEENHRLVEVYGFSFPVVIWEDAVADYYQVPGTPFFYVIDNKGVIVNRGFGKSLEQLEALAQIDGE